MSQKQNIKNWFLKAVSFVGFLSLLVAPVFSTPVDSQSSSNKIGLYIARIKNGATGEFEAVTKIGTNNYKYDGTLTLDDEIRYAWAGVGLSLDYKTNPTWGGGYLKVYLNDDSKESNHIIDYGSSPLPVSKIAHKLASGENKILLVYVDKSGNPAVPLTKVAFTFNFKNDTNRPEIEVVSPDPGVVLSGGHDVDFVLRIKNFSLESQDSGQLDRGKMNIYYNEVSKDNLIGTVASSAQGDGYSEVTFSTKDYENFVKIPDSLDSELIFVLTKSNGDLLDYRAEIDVKTNYNGEIDVGLPKVEIVEPNKQVSNPTVTGDTVFKLEISNFDILSSIDTSSLEAGKGYLQIRVDDVLVKDIYSKTEFTLNELGVDMDRAGTVKIEVNLTNKNFERLVPDASDSISVVFEQSETDNDQSDSSIKSNTWRLIIMVLTVTLIIGSIAVLITKG